MQGIMGWFPAILFSISKVELDSEITREERGREKCKGVRSKKIERKKNVGCRQRDERELHTRNKSFCLREVREKIKRGRTGRRVMVLGWFGVFFVLGWFLLSECSTCPGR